MSTGSVYNIIYRDGKMRFQAPALCVRGNVYVNLATGRAVMPLTVELMRDSQKKFHAEQVNDMKRKWGML